MSSLKTDMSIPFYTEETGAQLMWKGFYPIQLTSGKKVILLI